MPAIDLVLADVDNTLVPFGKGGISRRTADAIRAVRATGLRFGPATGRDESELRRFFWGDETCYRTGVLSNGKKVKLDGELVALHLIDNHALQAMADAVGQLPACAVFAFPLEPEPQDVVYFVGSVSDAFLAGVRRNSGFVGRRVPRVPDVPLIAATVACESYELRPRAMRLAAAVTGELVLVDAPAWIDVIPSGVSKASGFGELLAAMGIGAERTVFFGDGENDLQIMGRTPHSVAVANAVPSVMRAARFHVGACADDGVADALEELARARAGDREPTFLLG